MSFSFGRSVFTVFDPVWQKNERMWQFENEKMEE